MSGARRGIINYRARWRVPRPLARSLFDFPYFNKVEWECIKHAVDGSDSFARQRRVTRPTSREEDANTYHETRHVLPQRIRVCLCVAYCIIIIVDAQG